MVAQQLLTVGEQQRRELLHVTSPNERDRTHTLDLRKAEEREERQEVVFCVNRQTVVVHLLQPLVLALQTPPILTVRSVSRYSLPSSSSPEEQVRRSWRSITEIR